MSLSGTISNARSGLNSIQLGVDITSQNIANAETIGYTKKTLQLNSAVGGTDSAGVSTGEISREVNLFLQARLRSELAEHQRLNVQNEFLTSLDQFFGKPGDVNALDTIFNNFGGSLNDLATSPEQYGVRDSLLSQAQLLANHLNTMSTQIQSLRQQAETGLSNAVTEANEAMQQIARINAEIQSRIGDPQGSATLEDERDRHIDKLAELMDIRVTAGEKGAVRVFTEGGNLLVGAQAATLEFDPSSGLDATALFTSDPATSAVGTVTFTAFGGSQIDLFRNGNIGSGKIAAYRELRDEILVEAQAQLDELAHGLALSLSSTTNDGTAVTSGAQAGFDVDISNLIAGNTVSFNYTQTPPGTTQSVTFVRVDDPSVLPLANDVTPDPNDTVYGIDFSGGLAAAVAAMDAAVGGSITISSPSATSIRILDDGAVGTIAINSASSYTTASNLQDDGLGLPLFVDGLGTSVYSGAITSDGSQKTGFAQSISVNQSLLSDNTLLVQHSTSPATAIGDPERPLSLIDRFSNANMAFSPSTGIGGGSSPFSGSVDDFARRIVSFQANNAENVQRNFEAKDIMITTMADKFIGDVSVNVDEEMAKLLELQNAYAANARVLTVVQELMDILIRI